LFFSAISASLSRVLRGEEALSDAQRQGAMLASMQEVTETFLGCQNPFLDWFQQLRPCLAAKNPLAQPMPRNEYIVEVTCCSLHKVEPRDAGAACLLIAGVAAWLAAVCVMALAASNHFASPPRS